jgi:hypothetical protein
MCRYLDHMLTSYVRKCLNYAAFYIILSGAVLILVSILMPTSSISQINKKPSLSKSSTFLFITVLVTVLLIQKVGNFKEDYKINDFIALTSRIREYGSAAPVILAEDENSVSMLENGTISGSTKTIMKGVRNLVDLGIPLESAVKMSSFNPACTLGIQNLNGSISVGNWGDLVILDKNLAVIATFINGLQNYKGGIL